MIVIMRTVHTLVQDVILFSRNTNLIVELDLAKRYGKNMAQMKQYDLHITQIFIVQSVLKID